MADWIFGIHATETIELFFVLLAFFGTFAGAYFIQRWISGDEYYR